MKKNNRHIWKKEIKIIVLFFFFSKYQDSMCGSVKSMKEMTMAIDHLFLKNCNYQNALLAAFHELCPVCSITI